MERELRELNNSYFFTQAESELRKDDYKNDKEYKKEVRNKYNITKEQQEEISMEGLNKNWPMPEMLPYPDCCD